MEDAATAEISRAQIWQWVHQPNGVLSDGRKITPDLVRRLFQEQMGKLQEKLGTEQFDRGNFDLARKLIEGIVLKSEFTEFMTLVGYEFLD
jgi:malate synthase